MEAKLKRRTILAAVMKRVQVITDPTGESIQRKKDGEGRLL